MNRYDLLRGYYELAAQRSGISGILSRKERNRSRRQLLKSLSADDDLWVFGYGSLIFNPGFNYAERLPGTLYGYHRCFCIWSRLARGTSEQPGLVLGLNPGGSCKGIVYRIPFEMVNEGSTILWAREMLVDAYQPKWITVLTAARSVRAVTFIADKRSGHFAGNLSQELCLNIIATSSGFMGSSVDYLRRIVGEFALMDIRSPDLERLHRLVEVRCNTFAKNKNTSQSGETRNPTGC